MYVTLSDQAISADAEATLQHVQTTSGCQNRYNAGAHLFFEGDTSENVYEIRSGVLRLTRVLENGRRQVIAFGLPGDIVGFPNGDLHHTNCDAITKAEVISHRRKTLESGAGDPALHQHLLQAALREISAMQDHFMMLARKSALEKVASFLLVLSRRMGTPIANYSTFALPMMRADIADFLGLTIETVSRTFTLLRKAGIIALQSPQTVLVRDMQRLIDASQLAE